MADNLPDEVMVEILSRLPAKSLCKFRCVSKFWCNLTLDFNFVKMHLNRAIQRDNREIIVKNYKVSDHGKDGKEGTIEELFVVPNNIIRPAYRTFIYCVDVEVGSLENSHAIDVSFGDYCNISRLLGSCNGIVCLGRDYHICLLNPCTREYKILEVKMDNICKDRDAFYDFGYDVLEEVYTLVRVDKRDNGESEISVYSLRDDDIYCSKVSNVPYRIKKNLGVFLNGAFHWVAHYQYIYAKRIISFDVGSKVVLEFSKPENLPDDGDDFTCERPPAHLDAYLALVAIEGNLAVAMFKRDCTILEIWVMQVYSVADSWCKLFSVREDMCFTPCRWPSHFDELGLGPLHFIKNAEVLINNGETVVMYDLKRRTARVLDIRAILDRFHNDRLVIHVPSLVSLKSGTYVGGAIADKEKEKTQRFRFSFRS